ncbi:MAG: type 1 glutamine amidotransferase domain-containing protein [Myxococcota bacterium]
MSQPKILIVVTSHAQLGDTGTPTGLWLEELAVPYVVFTDAGAEVDIASPAGGKPPIDPKSAADENELIQRFNSDPMAQAKLAATLRIDSLDKTYDAVFVAGGHGVMWDLAVDQSVADLLSSTYERSGVVAAVCHGPGAPVPVKLSSGQPLVAGHRVAGFTNEEESAVGLSEVVPFLLQDKLTELGGRYESGPQWQPFAVRDGRLVTGQNPASSAAVAQETLRALEQLGAR